MKVLEDFFPHVQKKHLPYVFLILFLTSYSISALMSTSSLTRAQSNSFSIWTTLTMFGYVLIIYVMKSFGKPNRFELIIIPTLIIGIIFLGLNTFNVQVVEDPSEETTTSTSSELSDTDFSDQSVETQQGTITQTSSRIEETEDRMGIPDDLLFQLQIIGAIVLMVGAILYFYYSREGSLPEMRLIEDLSYETSLARNNMQIMEYYIESSKLLENTLGLVEMWIAPTSYSEEIKIEPGPPVGDYFHVLTELYELARFSSTELNDAHVAEAEELYSQIKGWVNRRLG